MMFPLNAPYVPLNSALRRAFGHNPRPAFSQKNQREDEGNYQDREHYEFSDEVLKHRLRFVVDLSKLRCQNQYAPDRSNETNKEKRFRNKNVFPERDLNCVQQLHDQQNQKDA